MRRLAFLAVLLFACAVGPAQSHNNPSFEKKVILELAVQPQANPQGAHTGPFALELPKKTIQLHYAVTSDERRGIRFSIAAGGEVVAEGLTDGGRSKVLRSDDLTIVALTGATQAFTLQIVAEILVRNKTS